MPYRSRPRVTGTPLSLLPWIASAVAAAGEGVGIPAPMPQAAEGAVGTAVGEVHQRPRLLRREVGRIEDERRDAAGLELAHASQLERQQAGLVEVRDVLHLSPIKR